MKVQEALKESKRETDRARDRNTFLENARREVETDLREMQRCFFLLESRFKIMMNISAKSRVLISRPLRWYLM